MSIAFFRRFVLTVVAVAGAPNFAATGARAEAWSLPVSAAERLPLRLQRAAAWLTLAAALGDTDAGALWAQAVGPHVSKDGSLLSSSAVWNRLAPLPGPEYRCAADR